MVLLVCFSAAAMLALATANLHLALVAAAAVHEAEVAPATGR
jgi:hypothetical protein